MSLRCYFFTDRLPFSLLRDNGHRIQTSKSIMFDGRRTLLQFYYNQCRSRYYRSRRYDRGLTHGYSKYLSYSTIKVCFSLLIIKRYFFCSVISLLITNKKRYSFSYVIRKIEVIPASRLQSIRGSDLARSTEATRHTGPCGGFSTQYACMCDLHGVPYREEVAWVRFKWDCLGSRRNTELSVTKVVIRDTNFRMSTRYICRTTRES